MNILLCGIAGHMGREVLTLASAGYRNASVTLGVDPMYTDTAEKDTGVLICKKFSDIPAHADVDCIIDFSHHSAVAELLPFAIERHLPTVVATTGHDETELSMIHEAAKHIPVFHSANMSLGVALLVELAQKAVAAMPDAEIEIIEKHHDRKLDAPSGTARMLASAIQEIRPELYTNVGRNGNAKRTKNEIGIHSVRMGNIVGVHEVLLATPSQTITLRHEAHSRALFAEGALAAADHIMGAAAGLYDMYSLVSGIPAAETLCK